MPMMTGVCKVGIEGAATLLDRPSYILSSHGRERTISSGGAGRVGARM
jgi:hypothetical protein